MTITRTFIVRLVLAGLGIATVLGAAGCGTESATPAPRAKTSGPPAPSYLHVQDSDRRATLLVIAGERTGGFDLNGTENGAMRLVVPVGWQVTVTLRNRSRLHNSLAVVRGPASRTPAFAGAGAPLRSLAKGIAHGRTAVFRFRAERVGTYRLASLVKGHEASGMWATVVVVARGRPSLTIGPIPRTGGSRP